MVCIVLIRIIETFNQAITDAARYRHCQMALIEVESRFNHCVLDVINDLFLDEPAFVAKVGTHEPPKLRIYVFLLMRTRRGISTYVLLVLELRLYTEC